ncbi:hypothetical protein ARMSODRAFT_652857 [Armillaria solidipes]|uniref:Uncharacterized protein n=1 Tax=Armillaria solidipes TaxID=1076256 RepID=A0A2H3BPG7_9AGAR|nr:hypothetical protein ARMSODRAFT_366027 [Armillaria solidipes]PBK73884.1 hypothetical protein ARMSODRAFT_652857 [Armillaria solidipes]
MVWVTPRTSHSITCDCNMSRLYFVRSLCHFLGTMHCYIFMPGLGFTWRPVRRVSILILMRHSLDVRRRHPLGASLLAVWGCRSSIVSVFRALDTSCSRHVEKKGGLLSFVFPLTHHRCVYHSKLLVPLLCSY